MATAAQNAAMAADRARKAEIKQYLIDSSPNPAATLAQLNSNSTLLAKKVSEIMAQQDATASLAKAQGIPNPTFKLGQPVPDQPIKSAAQMMAEFNALPNPTQADWDLIKKNVIDPIQRGPAGQSTTARQKYELESNAILKALGVNAAAGGGTTGSEILAQIPGMGDVAKKAAANSLIRSPNDLFNYAGPLATALATAAFAATGAQALGAIGTAAPTASAAPSAGLSGLTPAQVAASGLTESQLVAAGITPEVLASSGGMATSGLATSSPSFLSQIGSMVSPSGIGGKSGGSDMGTLFGIDTNLLTSALSTAGSIYTGVQGVKAAGAAADATAGAADRAAQTQWDMYAQSRADQMPWLQAGTQALGDLQTQIADGPGDFTKSPGYDFRLAEGEKARLRNATATGNVASGETLKALEQYSQDYASNEYDRFLSRYYDRLKPLQSLSGVGQTTATNTGADAIATGRQVGNLGLSAGAARSSGYINQANARTGAIQGVANTIGTGLGTYFGQQQPYAY